MFNTTIAKDRSRDRAIVGAFLLLAALAFICFFVVEAMPHIGI